MSKIKLTFERDSQYRDLEKEALSNNRTVEEQVLHWCKVGQNAEENPDLTYDFMQMLDVDLMEKTVDLARTQSEKNNHRKQ